MKFIEKAKKFIKEHKVEIIVGGSLYLGLKSIDIICDNIYAKGIYKGTDIVINNYIKRLQNDNFNLQTEKEQLLFELGKATKENLSLKEVINNG